MEVKYDRKQARTGNVAIEYANSRQGKFSGIMATTAHFWGLVLDDPRTAWLARVSDLYAHVRSVAPLAHYERAGDGNAAIWVYRWQDVSGLFRRIDQASVQEVVEVLRA